MTKNIASFERDTCLYEDKRLMVQYSNILKDYLDNGIIEKVDTTPDNKKLLHFLSLSPSYS